MKPAIEGGKPVRENNFLVFGAPDLQQKDIDEVVDTLKSGWLSTGPKVKLFESKFAKYNLVQYAIGTNSCTAALHLCLEALDLPAGSEVITTSMTFCATVNAIIHAGLKPVLADCSKHDFNILPEEIEKKITPNTKVILPVHFAGFPCDMEAIRDIATRYGLFVVSDAAHAIESRYKGSSVAKWSDLTAYSFYATKNICTGEGGMVLTDNKEYADKIRIMGLHGISKDAHLRYSSSGFKHYYVETLGYKYNMLDITASLGINQLDRATHNWYKRQRIWERYCNELRSLPLFLPPSSGDRKTHGHHLFTITLDLDRLSVGRDFILDALVKEGIGTGVHYQAAHLHPYYKRYGWLPNECPNATWISGRTLSLPISSKLSDEDVNDVITATHKVLSYYTK